MMNKLKYWLNRLWWNRVARYSLTITPRDRSLNEVRITGALFWQNWLELNVGRQGLSWDWRVNDDDTITVKFINRRDWAATRTLVEWRA